MTDTEFREVLAACELALRLYGELSANAGEQKAKDLDVVSSRLNDIFSALDDKAEKLGKAGERAAAIADVDKKVRDSLAELRKTFTLTPAAGGAAESAVPSQPPATPPAAGAGEAAKSGEAVAKAGELGLTDRLNPDARDMMGMDEFFATVSTSLMRAQAALNDRSLEYVSALDPRFPPVYYGIPSVRAEMRVGFNRSRQRGINLILFSNSTQKAEYGESTVSFEVVGTPPPPGPASYGNYVVPVPRFMVVGDRRDEVIARVRADKNLDQTVYANAEENVLVLRYERAAEADPTRYLILWPAKKADASFDHWHTLAVVYAVEALGPDGELRLLYPEAAETADEKKVESIFEFPPKATGQVLTLNPDSLGKVASLATLVTLDKTKLAQLVVNLGDVLMNVNLVLGQWLRAVEYRPPAPPAPGGAAADKG